MISEEKQHPNIKFYICTHKLGYPWPIKLQYATDVQVKWKVDVCSS